VGTYQSGEALLGFRVQAAAVGGSRGVGAIQVWKHH
jgi:hypothetical protein